MSTVTTAHLTAADALTAKLPTTRVLRAVQGTAPGSGTDSIVASFIGSVSADIALLLFDLDALTAAAGTSSALVSVTDVARPALEAAANTFGTGVLGDARLDDASALFADRETVTFDLITSDGSLAGHLGVRVRGSRNTSAAASDVAGKLGRISNVEMSLTVEIGRTRMAVRDVLGLEPGAVVELDRSAGAPADVLLNGRVIAHGEVVVIDQDYAVRITKILELTEGIL